MKNTLKTVLLYAAVVLVIIFAVSLMLSSSNKTAPTYGDIIDLFTAGKVTEFDVNKNNQFKVTEKLFIHKCNANIVTFL